MDVVFFLHGNGPASRWAAAAAVGDDIAFFGPTKSMPRHKGKPDWALFLGDESAIGLAASLLETLPHTTQVMGAIELDDLDAPALGALDLPLHTAIRKQKHGAPLLEWLEQTPLPDGKGMIWLSGEASSARALKRMLAKRDRDGVRLKVKTYWSCKGHAHRKALDQMDIAAK